ncbi:MAG: amidohydrolase family protein [Desulfobacterales bacterium]|nr:amidohydrolase family protein [Desulfobacterales bacterium]
MPDNKKISRREFLEKTTRYSTAAALSGVIPFVGSSCSGSKDNSEYDVIIKNGMVYDGTLNPPFVADIGIKGDRILTMGTVNGTASKTIDANGKIITPGFIDVHTHCDLTFKRSGLKRYLAYVMSSFKGNYNYLYQGVTTVITGNCGYGYTDTEKWFDIANSVNFGSNICHLAPHGMIRMELFGSKQPGELSQTQLEAMKKKVAEEMEKGAFGFSTGLEYAPGLLSTTDELIEINKVVNSYGGIYTTHIRDLTGSIRKSGNNGIIETLNEAITISKKAEIPLQLSHLGLKAPFNGVKSEQILEIIDKARLNGFPIHADQFPYPSGSTLLSARLSQKFKSDTGVLDRYKNKEGRQQLKKAVEYRFTISGPEKVLITICPENKDYEGRTLKEIADETGRKPVDVYVDLVCEDPAPIAIFFDHNESVLRDIMKRDYIITASDSWTIPKDFSKIHPQAYGTFPKKIRKYAMDEPLVNFQQAIRSMTSLPAEVFKIKKRGIIRSGYFADIAVIDLKKLTDHATYRDPHQYCEGIEHLFVNGTHSIENGIATGKRNGKTLKRS